MSVQFASMLEGCVASLPPANKLLSSKSVGVFFLYVVIQLFAIGEGLVTSVWSHITVYGRDDPLSSRAELH